MKKLQENFGGKEICSYFCGGIGEKSRSADALAYYFALTEKVWKTHFGMVRFKKQGKGRKWSFLSTGISYAPRYGVEHSYPLRGVPNSRPAP